jgi:hypothetical protein
MPATTGQGDRLEQAGAAGQVERGRRAGHGDVEVDVGGGGVPGPSDAEPAMAAGMATMPVMPSSSCCLRRADSDLIAPMASLTDNLGAFTSRN